MTIVSHHVNEKVREAKRSARATAIGECRSIVAVELNNSRIPLVDKILARILAAIDERAKP
jgi:hypothetical protein